MGFQKIRTFHFRNLIDQVVDLSGRELFFVGENGQGKTSFLEAIYLLSFGGSFRTSTDTLLVQHGQTQAAVEGYFVHETDGNGDDVLFKLEEDQSGTLKKEIRYNGKLIRDRREIVSAIPCIVFSHEDISFVTGPPERRRRFFNQTMSLHDPVFIDRLRRYEKVLRMRNRALKERREDLVEVYDEELAASGLEIQLARISTTQEFNEVFAELFLDISGLSTELSIHYLPAWRDCANPAAVLSHLSARRAADASLGATTSGPHRDRFLFSAGGRNFANVASTGQLRLASLILRVAQALYFTRKTGRRPLLLLDDVLLELDLKRRERFLSRLPDADQRFFTFLPDEQFRPFVTPGTRIYHVVNGAILPS